MRSENRAEQELVRRAKSGDREAFDILARQVAQMTYNLAYRLAGNPADAQDIAQEALLNAYRSIGKFNVKSSFETWMYRITVNLWKNRVRYEKRRSSLKHFSIDELKVVGDGEAPREFVDPSPDPPAAYARRQDDERILDALGELDSRTRAIIVLNIVEKRTYKEIAEIVGCSLRTVNNRISFAREFFRKKFVEGGRDRKDGL